MKFIFTFIFVILSLTGYSNPVVKLFPSDNIQADFNSAVDSIQDEISSSNGSYTEGTIVFKSGTYEWNRLNLPPNINIRFNKNVKVFLTGEKPVLFRLTNSSIANNSIIGYNAYLGDSRMTTIYYPKFKDRSGDVNLFASKAINLTGNDIEIKNLLFRTRGAMGNCIGGGAKSDSVLIDNIHARPLKILDNIDYLDRESQPLMPGWSVVQLQGGKNITINNISGYGGITLRLEQNSAVEGTMGLINLTANNIINYKGKTAVLLAPGKDILEGGNTGVKITNVKTFGASYGLKISSFRNGTSPINDLVISDVEVHYGTDATYQAKFQEDLPEEVQNIGYFLEISGSNPNIYVGPSLGVISNKSNGLAEVDNLTCFGFPAAYGQSNCGETNGDMEDCDFKLLPESALDIGAGGGKTYMIGTNRRVYKWNGSVWKIQTGGPQANRIDVTSNGKPWIVATDGKIYKLVNNQWKRVSGWASDIGCGSNKVYIVGNNGKIFKWTGGNSWIGLTTSGNGTGKRIDVAKDGNPWIVGTNDHVYQYKQKWLKKGSFKARDISIQDNGSSIWTLSKSAGNISFYEGGGVWKKFEEKGNNISIQNNEDMWLVDGDRQIFVNNCPAVQLRSTANEGAYFQAQVNKGRTSKVFWIMDQKYAPETYILEYAKGDNSFVELETIAASNESGFVTYEYVHNFPVAGQNQYQLRIIHENGVEDVLPFKTVTFGTMSSQIDIFPNPANEEVFLDLSNYMDEKIEYTVSNLFGQVIKKGIFTKNHLPRERLDLNGWRNGNYLISVKPENHRQLTNQLVIVKPY